MVVHDIVRIVGPATQTSYPTNSRVLVNHFYDELAAIKTCDRYNQLRNYLDYRYEVENYDELSPNRANPEK